MALIRCPRCELNYIQADEKVCEVCRRQMHGLREEVEELCVECGTRPVASGEDVCRVCLREALGRASLVAQVVTVADEPLDTEEEEEDTVPVPAEEEIAEDGEETPEAEDPIEVPMIMDEEEDIDEDEEDLPLDERKQ